MRYEYIKSMKLAGILMQRGFRLYKVEQDKFHPTYDVYLFKKTSELSDAIKEYSNSVSGGNEDGIDNERS